MTLSAHLDSTMSQRHAAEHACLDALLHPALCAAQTVNTARARHKNTTDVFTILTDTLCMQSTSLACNHAVNLSPQQTGNPVTKLPSETMTLSLPPEQTAKRGLEALGRPC